MLVMDLDRPSGVAGVLGDWQPLAGKGLLDRLRITGRPRPAADPERAEKLCAVLEQGLRNTLDEDVAPPVTPTPASTSPLVVTKDRLTRALSGGGQQSASEFGSRMPTVPLACGAMVDALFRQLITVGSIGDPMTDALAALSLDDRQRELVSWIECLPVADRGELRAEVELHADGLLRRWPTLDPAWLPRTQEAMRFGLAGGTVELSARVDLAIGAPATKWASVAIVEVKSGVRRIEHRADLHFYALIEALRSAAPPFVVATYYTKTGELDVEPVTDELLFGACRRTLAGISALLRTGSER
jgi:hypothetical protein